MSRRIYCDNAATTPVDRAVIDAMMPYLTERFGNASSIHMLGQEARSAVDSARVEVALLVNAGPSEIVFTSGGTESNNLAIRGTAEANGESGGHIVISDIEHPAVKDVCADLETRGYSVTRVPTGRDGIVSAESVIDAVREETVLVSLMLANNEIGTLQPVAEVGRFVAGRQVSGQRVFLHTDAVQAVGKVPVDVEELHCDLLSLSAHKIYAPKGAGALYIKRGTKIRKQNLGGGQERKMRGGTENVAGIVALGKACSIAKAALAEEGARIASLRKRFEEEVLQRVPEVETNGNRDMRLPNISNLMFKGLDGEAILINLDMQGVAVSTGSACSSGTIEASPVIKALGFDEASARGAVRFSFGRMNTEDEIDAVVELVRATADRLRQLS